MTELHDKGVSGRLLRGAGRQKVNSTFGRVFVQRFAGALVEGLDAPSAVPYVHEYHRIVSALGTVHSLSLTDFDTLVSSPEGFHALEQQERHEDVHRRE